MEIVYGSVGVGVGLEVGNVAVCRALARKRLNACFDLFGDRMAGIACELAGTACAAEDTAMGSKFSIPVWAGTADVQGELI